MAGSDGFRFQPDSVESFAAELLQKAGLKSPHCEVVAEALVRADLRGVSSHGVARLDPYIAHLEAGGFNPDPDVTLNEQADGALVVDADNGPGQSAGKPTMERLISMAGQNGVAAGVVNNSNHFGTAAYYTEMAANADCIGMAMTNVPAEVIPFGGREPYLGTNPIAISSPSPKDHPITLDMATSIVAMGKIDHVASEKGEKIPDDWGVDSEGNPTTDPDQVSALRPVGGPKGYGLGVIVEILAGILSGAGQSTTMTSLYDDYEDSLGVGHFYLALDVDTFMNVDEFESGIGSFIEGIKDVATGEDVSEVMLPGEIEANTLQQNRRNGVPIEESVFENLRAQAEKYGVDLPSKFQSG
jgi:ureidoglycolate dehydrogenase (NAD+)